MKYNKDNVAVWIFFTSIAIIIWYLAMGYKDVEAPVLQGGDICNADKIRCEQVNKEHAIQTEQYR
jgi:hypothetical protein